MTIDESFRFLLDLDGTLVLTDDIYYEVWDKILSKYNIVLSKEIFSRYIQGNNDKYVFNTLLPTVKINPSKISTMKDNLFIKNISKIKIIEGVYSFIQQIKEQGHKCCIITNCNRRVAEEIVRYTELDVDFIISIDDCSIGKPSPIPYQLAISRYGVRPNKCFIFEDSKTGIISGKQVNPRLLVGIQTIYSEMELKNYGVSFSIKNYLLFNIDTMISLTNDSANDKTEKLRKMIIQSIPFDNPIIMIDDTKLKGGFIADVICFQIQNTGTIGVGENNKNQSFILKYENEGVNLLSSMAKQLELYKREYYFYETISKYINVKIPQFISTIQDESGENKGIILENLNRKGFQINLNLNTESIDVSLKIVDRIARMHSRFWNNELLNESGLMNTESNTADPMYILKRKFPQLKKTDDPIFRPFLQDFITERYETFKTRWTPIISSNQMAKCGEIVKQFGDIQERLSHRHLTFIHGDVKSPNLFYDVEHGNEPYFLDWQHCGIGKGVQDLVFFVIESFDIHNIPLVYPLFKHYYFKKIQEYGVKDYLWEEYKQDCKDAIYYVPFFTAIWFGTIPQDELIDKNFPYFFITKLFSLM